MRDKGQGRRTIRGPALPHTLCLRQGIQTAPTLSATVLTGTGTLLTALYDFQLYSRRG